MTEVLEDVITQKHQSPRLAVVMFADLVQSSDVSVFVPLSQYDVIIREFQRNSNEVLTNQKIWARKEDGKADCMIRGDEVYVILYSSPDMIDKDIETALKTAASIKRRWIFSSENRRRFKEHQEPLGLSVGIHTGYVQLGPSVYGKAETAEGYCINFAKRVETSGRKGESSMIILSRDAYYPISRNTVSGMDLGFWPPFQAELKGISSRSSVYEVAYFADSNEVLSPIDFATTKIHDYKPLSDVKLELVGFNEPFEWFFFERVLVYFEEYPWDINIGTLLVCLLSTPDSKLVREIDTVAVEKREKWKRALVKAMLGTIKKCNKENELETGLPTLLNILVTKHGLGK